VSPQHACACAIAMFAATFPPHLRVNNERILEVVQFAVERSPTFRALIAAIEASRLIVYVDEGTCRHRTIPSCTQSVADGPYVRVLVDPREPITAVVRQLAHEFQHVAEIATRPNPLSASVIRALYERIGFQSCSASSDCYETQKALEVESRVSREISSRHTASIDAAFFGEWSLNIDQSLFETCPPSIGRRFDRDQRHGLASAVVEFVDCLGIEHRDAFVYKADGHDYPITGGNGRPSRTIAVTVIDDLSLAFVIKDDRVVVACGRRTTSADGKAMTIETLTILDGEQPRRTVEFWKRKE
jgi:hypothetical protein